jgi:hypothetical protein
VQDIRCKKLIVEKDAGKGMRGGESLDEILKRSSLKSGERENRYKEFGIADLNKLLNIEYVS